MATVDKNFKVKHGLIVEGTTATVNGDNIVTEDAIQTITNKTTPNLTINDGTGNGGAVYAEGNNVTVSAANDLYLNTTSGDINLQPDGAAKIYGKEIATKEYVDGQVPDNTDGLSEGTTNKYFTDQRAKDAAATLITGATKTNITITGDGNGLTIAAENGVADSTTDDLAEGATNLYFTKERAQDAIGLYVGDGLTYDDASGVVSVKIGNYDNGAIGFDNGYIKVRHDANPSETGTLTVQGSANQLAVNTNVIASRAHVDSLIGDTSVDGTSGNTVTDRIATAVAGLVDGAPALLDTLNELAAAIGDDSNYATTVAGLVAAKQDTLTAGSGININPSTDEISVDDTVIASKDYVDTNFVGFDDLPGQLGDYVPLTQKGANDGVATLDSTGQVPLNQLGNVPDAYITSTGTDPNLSVTSGTLSLSLSPNFNEVDVNAVAKQVAATVSANVSTQTVAYQWDQTTFPGAKFLVKVVQGSNIEISELLVAYYSGNYAITEYAIVSSNGTLANISIAEDGFSGAANLVVTPTVGNSTISVSGTLLV